MNSKIRRDKGNQLKQTNLLSPSPALCSASFVQVNAIYIYRFRPLIPVYMILSKSLPDDDDLLVMMTVMAKSREWCQLKSEEHVAFSFYNNWHGSDLALATSETFFLKTHSWIMRSETVKTLICSHIASSEVFVGHIHESCIRQKLQTNQCDIAWDWQCVQVCRN